MIENQQFKIEKKIFLKQKAFQMFNLKTDRQENIAFLSHTSQKQRGKMLCLQHF